MDDNLHHLMYRGGEHVDDESAAYVKCATFHFLALYLKYGDCGVIYAVFVDGLSLRCWQGHVNVWFCHFKLMLK